MHGELGHGDNLDRMVFSEIQDAPQNAMKVVCGGFFTYILLTDGRILSCGDNRFGQLGHGNNKEIWRFKEIESFAKHIRDCVW